MSDWRSTTLQEIISTIESGSRPKGGIRIGENSEGVPSYGGENITMNGGMLYDSVRMVPANFAAEMKRGILSDRDILINKDGANTGKSAIYRRPAGEEFATINEHLFLIRCNKDAADQEFLYHFLNSELGKSQIARVITGSAQPGLNSTFPEFIRLDLPPLPEQKKITEILSGIDKCIAGTRTIKERIRATSKAIQDEFVLATVSGRTEHSFADLGSIADIRGRIGWKGYTKEDLVESGALVLGGTQISKDNQIDLSKPVFISDFKYRESPEIMVNPGDLVLVKTGNTIGKIALVPNWNQEATINPNTAIIRARYPLNQYLLFALSSEYYQRKLWDLVAVGAQPSVNQANLKAIAIPIPEEKEMIALCEQFASLNRMLRTTEAKAVKLEYLKNAVSSDLLSGRKRVSV